MTVWVIRSGKYGERDQWCLNNGYAGGGRSEFGDLTGVQSKDQMRDVVAASSLGQRSAVSQGGFTGQLWALRDEIGPGDVIVMPMKTTREIAFGTCKAGYTYLADEPDPSRRHVVLVDWKRTDVPRSALGQDLLYTLGGLATIFKPTKHEAERRLTAVMATGIDPDADNAEDPADADVLDDEAAAVSDTDDSVTAPTLDAIRDRIREKIITEFREHEFTELIASILRCHGFTCTVSAPGPDQGVDILCGSGPLGLDSPTLIVECKSGRSQQGAPVARALQGAVTNNRADQGLLVAWGGITKEAEREIRNERLRLGVWGPEQVLDNLFEVYERLPDTIRMRLPLRQLWALDDV